MLKTPRKCLRKKYLSVLDITCVKDLFMFGLSVFIFVYLFYNFISLKKSDTLFDILKFFSEV